MTDALADLAEATMTDDLEDLATPTIGGKVKISLADMDLPSLGARPQADLKLIDALLASMAKVTPSDDAKLQHLKAQSGARSPRRSTPATARC
jgi:hypothetical protein